MRDKQIDGLKFIMIFCVVLGHIGFNDYGLGIHKVIYSFHMPVFIFLSGYLTSLKSPQTKINKWLIKTIIIYVCVQLFFHLFSFEDSVNFSKFLSLDIYCLPVFAMWYLICLVYWRLFTCKILNYIKDIELLGISVLFALISGFIPIDDYLSFQRVFAFFPFFVFGVVFKNRNMLVKLEMIPIKYYIWALFVGLIIARLLPCELYQPKYHYSNINGLVIRLVQSTLGLFLCIIIVRLSRHASIERFSIFGQKTLWIYIGHIFLIKIGGFVFAKYDYTLNFIEAILLSIIYCAIIICINNCYLRLQRNDL